MPRTTSSLGSRISSVTEIPQRQSPRGGLPNVRTSSADSDPLHHHRPRTERSPRLSEGRSPRGTLLDPLNKKKLGTRIADLESQLGQAQGELKSLKDQLASAEAAKKAAQEQLNSKKLQNPEVVELQEKKHDTTTVETNNNGDCNVFEAFENGAVETETDVFEVVPIEKVTVEPKSKSEPEILPFDELDIRKEEIGLLKSKLDDKDNELEIIREENAKLQSQLNEMLIKLSAAESKIEEMNGIMDKSNQELETSKTGIAQITEKLYANVRANEELENEMKKLRVQTEQWRKAADAAASILAGGVDTNGRMIPERCGSMDKHYGNNVFEARSSGYRGYLDSPGLADDSDDVFGGGKKKGSSGIRMFGDFWRKKGQK